MALFWFAPADFIARPETRGTWPEATRYVDALAVPELWVALQDVVEREQRPLADAVVGFVKRSADFLKKGDIDGIGDKL